MSLIFVNHLEMIFFVSFEGVRESEGTKETYA